VARVTGLGTSLGIAQEVTPGTAVTPTRWLDARSESLGSEKTALNGGGLRGGALYARSSNRANIGKNVTGGWEQDVSTRGMGLLLKNCLGAGSSAVLTGSAYRQIFTPALLSGLSLTVQKILGSTAFTYNGYKISDWSLSADVGAILALSVDGDGWNEVTSFGAGTPSYTAAIESFNFTQGSVIVGGTATTSTGLTTVSGGTTVGIIQSVTVSGSRPLTTGDDNRRLSTTGKVEQVEDGILEVGGSLVADFDSAFDFYSLYSADTATALKLTFTTTATPITGATYPSIEILLPDVRLMGDTPKADGPGALSLDCDFIGLQDTVNGNPAVQIVTVTADTTIS
jgi:hypothetical protein